MKMDERFFEIESDGEGALPQVNSDDDCKLGVALQRVLASMETSEIKTLSDQPGNVGNEDLADIPTGVDKDPFLMDWTPRKASTRLSNRSHFLEHVSDGVVLTNRKGICIDVNSHACEILGYPAVELIGKDLKSMIIKDDRVRIATIRPGQTMISLMRVRRKDGSTCYIEAGHKVLHDGRTCTLLRDVTSRMRLEREILEISAREQRRIGQDLHDVLGQKLSGIAYLTRAVAGKLAEEDNSHAHQVAEIATLIGEAIAQVRALARGLSPVGLKADGLMNTLSQFSANVEHLFGVSCCFECQEMVLVHQEVKAEQLFYIVQEAVTNAIRHGRATSVVIRLLRFGKSRVRLEVMDNGIGLSDKENPSNGMGMHIMHYRARIIDGHLSIRNHRDRGVLVTCTFRNTKHKT